MDEHNNFFISGAFLVSGTMNDELYFHGQRQLGSLTWAPVQLIQNKLFLSGLTFNKVFPSSTSSQKTWTMDRLELFTTKSYGMKKRMTMTDWPLLTTPLKSNQIK